VPQRRPAPEEPCIKRILVPAWRRAVIDVWGEAGRAEIIEHLSGESREAFIRDLPDAHPEWFPVRHVIAWAFAAWEGPAKRVREDMALFVRRQWDLSFGVIRRLILHMAHPSSIVPRLADLWKQDNNCGGVDAELDDGGMGATIHVWDTPFVDTPHGRASVAEIYRHAFEQTRAKRVTETHALDGHGRMVIRLKWLM
jgi:hypothetical protein